MDSDPREQFIQHINELFLEVDKQAYERNIAGAAHYGSLGFLRNDTLEMAVEELIDLINYARYTAVKIKLLQEALAQKAAPLEQPETTGEGFISTEQLLRGFAE